ncbi:MAG: pleD 3 [Firmicutes bacterium]|nr:pleD 3 [Bacillota bacterium]
MLLPKYTSLACTLGGAVIALLVAKLYVYSYNVFPQARNHILLLFIFCVALASGLVGLLIQKLHYGAYTDALTNLWNRRYFYIRLGEEINRMRRTGAPLCIALVDVDDFKTINDFFGHSVGDNALVAIAGILRQYTRSLDVIFRWGGDEFVIIFPQTGLEQATKVSERVRDIIATSPECCNATVSVGLVAIDDDSDEKKVLELVDKLLYEAKKMKNFVVSSVSGDTR